LTTFARPAGGGEVEWRTSGAPVPYPEAVVAMENAGCGHRRWRSAELVWLRSIPALYLRTSGKPADLLDARFPMFATGRGGQLTYHGPGQGWPMSCST